MPSEKAKENKTLVSACAECGKSMSTELLHGVVEGEGRNRKIVPLCDACREKRGGIASGSVQRSPVTGHR